jgi:hypothetical protein
MQDGEVVRFDTQPVERALDNWPLAVGSDCATFPLINVALCPRLSNFAPA